MSSPFGTGAEARAAIDCHYEAAHGSIRIRVIGEPNHRMQCDVASTDGVELDADNRRIVAWLGGFEPETPAVLDQGITRAHAAPRPALAPEALAGSIGLTPEQINTVLDALGVAADYKNAMNDHPSHVLIMAAMRQADTENAARLRLAIQETWDEPGERHESPGGLILDPDGRAEKCAAPAAGRCEHDRHQTGGPLEPGRSRQARGQR
jgi:hypothetical protein